MILVMPKSRSQLPSAEVLCCCEYENTEGERSHILQCCCDCEAVDHAFDKCITCQKVPTSNMQKVLDTISDRCRIPGCSGKGAIQVKLDVITPIIMVPLCLCFATISFPMTLVVLVFMPGFMFVFYQVWRRHSRKQTPFFFIWALTSVIFSYLVFLFFVVAFREILLWENLLLFSAVVLMFYVLFKVKKNPGRLRTVGKRKLERRPEFLPNGDAHRVGERNLDEDFDRKQYGGNFAETADACSISDKDVKWVDSRPIRGGKLVTFCEDCNFKRPPRAGHCNICGVCIAVRDHHCVWIDNCIGANNHKSFLAAMLLFILCGSYGSHLTLTTVCTPEMYFDWLLLPNDCRFLYVDFQTSLCFVSVCYTLLATVVMCIGFCHQILLISQNVTSQELHQAATRGMTRLGVFAVNNVNNQGLLRNWMEFLFHHGRKSSPNIPL